MKKIPQLCHIFCILGQHRLLGVTGTRNQPEAFGARFGLVDLQSRLKWQERVFRPGARLHYDALAERATGEPVEVEAFAAQFLDDRAGA